MTKGVFAAPREVTSVDDCLFYHTTDVPGHGTVEGYWDIRGRESEYLGGVALGGSRVLEIGPGSGHLTFFMERQGAEVVSIEVAEAEGWECFWDLHERLPPDLEELMAENRAHLEGFKNSYWFCHRAFDSKAEVHYGSAYEMPRELGRFDLSVLACVLLHTKNPLRILENCARLTAEKIVVVEVLKERQLAQTHVEFLPAGDKSWWDTWWGFSPAYFVAVLRALGFPHSRVGFHSQFALGEPRHLFTVVAGRTPPAEGPPPAGQISAALDCPVERLRVRAGSLFHLPVNVTNRGGQPFSSSGEWPLLLSYHWRRESGEVTLWDGVRTPLPRPMFGGDGEEILMAVRAPADPGRYVLELTLISEGLRWHDGELPGLPLRVEASVT